MLVRPESGLQLSPAQRQMEKGTGCRRPLQNRAGHGRELARLRDVLFHSGLPHGLVPIFCDAPEPYNVSHAHLECGWSELSVLVEYNRNYKALLHTKKSNS